MSWFDTLLDGLFGDDEGSEAQRAWREHEEAEHERHQARSELREAEERYAAAVSRLLATDPVPVLREALDTGRHSLRALNLLRQVGADHPDLVRALLPELYGCCLSIGKPGIFGREVVRTLSRTTDLHDDLAPLVAATLRDEDEVTDVFAMRGLVMTLDDIGDTRLMDQWRRAALASTDPDVREIVEEYPPDEAPTTPREPDAPQ
ncbi:hypothetical protein [Streptomyces roseolilacinus]|uniref:Uncharacterized protein n=1 Tax=Streptomyces roseolilacinus TaxID=66904 RepID=A0A918B0Y2_9ACTN|nr:hypothetical protein [Streptomyces roseolilacinus]GGP97392.1 hypothetical protein GCM10010249_14830 [Streptomyces roseolilacinus]